MENNEIIYDCTRCDKEIKESEVAYEEWDASGSDEFGYGSWCIRLCKECYEKSSHYEEDEKEREEK